VLSDKYVYAAVILIIALILARTALYLLEGLLRLSHTRSKRLNTKLISVMETPIVVIIFLIGVELAVKRIIDIHHSFNNLVFSLIIILITYILIRTGSILLDAWSQRMSKEKGEEFHSEIMPLTRSVMTITLSVLGIILVLQVWGVEVGALLTSLGIAGVIIGFAFKETLENVFGGISLIIDNSFRKGDLIQLETGDIGEVMEINLRSTKLRNFDNETIIMPNGQLANTKIINLAQPTPTVRVKIPVSVAYGSDPDLVKEVLKNSLRGHKDILTMPRREVRFVNYGEFSIDFELIFYIKNYREIFHIKDAVLTQLYKDLYAAGIEIPFPIRTIVQAKKGQYDPSWKEEEHQPRATKKQPVTHHPKTS